MHVHAVTYRSGVDVLVIGNQGDGDPGVVGHHLVDVHGARLLRGWREHPENWPDPAGLDAVVLLGSDWSVYWDHVREAVAAESAFVRQVHARGCPLLGICFGAQLTAHALGGAVKRAPEPEIGWFEIEFEAPIGHDDAPFETGPWFQWHIDRFEVPSSARSLARSPRANQAFEWGRTLGVQFHPEVTAEMVERWSSGTGEEELSRHGVVAAELRERSRELAPTRVEATRALVDRWLEVDPS